MKVKIIKPTLSDLSEIITLWKKQYVYHHSLDAEYYVSDSKLLGKSFKKYLTKAIKENKPYILVARVNNKIVGFVTFNKETADYFDTRIKEYGEVIELFVESSYRNKGAGKGLMQEVERHLSKLGLTHVKLQSSTFNKSALSFYQRLGYINRQTLLFKKIKEEI